MLISNIYELDQLPFLKKIKYKWDASSLTKDQQQLYSEKQKYFLLENLRNISYLNNKIMSKLFLFQKNIKKDTSYNQQQNNKQYRTYQQMSILTQKQIISLKQFYDIISQTINDQKQFSQYVKQIKKFQLKATQYIKNQIMKTCDLICQKKQYLKFSIYLEKSKPNSLDFIFNKKLTQNQYIQLFIQKQNKFYIKAIVTNFDFQYSQQKNQHQQMGKNNQIKPFQIKNQNLIKKLIVIYSQLHSNFIHSSQQSQKQLQKFLIPLSKFQHQQDQQYLKVQVYKNYPLLRSKYYLPIKFNDPISNQRLDGPIFSNKNPQCMYSHFIGYNSDSIKKIEGNYCQMCRVQIENLQQNQLLTNLRDHFFNPYKTDVIFIPEFNRFKLLLKTLIKEQKEQKEQKQISQNQEIGQKINEFRTQIKYLNYFHLRTNLKKFYTKIRNKFNDNLSDQKFPLAFQFWGKKYLIFDPVRGRNCLHYSFTDLRMYYLNKVTEMSFKCPICEQIISDNDLLFLRQTQILMKYIRYKTQNYPELGLISQCIIDHDQQRLFITYNVKQKGDTNKIQLKKQEINKFYPTLIDPYINFNQFTLEIPDKYSTKLREQFLFNFGQKKEKEIDQTDYHNYL